MIRSRFPVLKVAVGFTVSIVPMIVVVAAIGYFSIAKFWNGIHEIGDSYLVADRTKK